MYAIVLVSMPLSLGVATIIGLFARVPLPQCWAVGTVVGVGLGAFWGWRLEKVLR